ncbi:MAG: putative adhesin, partial [Bacteroidota bacterium]
LSSTEVLSSGTYYAAQVINGVQSTDLAATEITIIPNTSVTTPVSACDSYSWNGTTYSASGTYTGTTENCITQLLSLTITPSSTNTTTASSCDSYSWNGTTYSASGTYTGTTENCVTQLLSLTITPSSTNTTTTSAVGTYTWAQNGQTYTSSGVYTGSTVNCLTQALNLTIIPYSTTLSLKVFLDGYYQYGSTPASMVAARYLNLVEAGSASPGAVTDVDLITVQLRSATNTETIVHTVTPILQTNGNVQCVFPPAATGNSYYIVLDHKGSNPLWSANPITLTSSSTYDFTNNLGSAYSDGDPSLSPMHTIVSGLYGIWLGELNEDGYLDAVDYSDLELDIYASGYLGLYLLDADLNGDTYVDASDFAVFDSNSNYGAYEQRPF